MLPKSWRMKILNWLGAGHVVFDTSCPEVIAEDIHIVGSSKLSSDGLTFTVYHANGGIVVETMSYDNRTGNRERDLHIIVDEQDFGKEINRIIFLRDLSR